MKIDRILIDLDDVLNDFTREALVHVTGIHDFTHKPEWGYDIVRAAGEISTAAGVHPRGSHWHTNCTSHIVAFDPKEFWKQLKQHHWADMEVTDWCHELIDICAKAVGGRNVCILTSPTLDPQCLAGKMEWIQEKMPKWLQRQFLIGPCKRFCSSPGALLIDDCQDNVDEFRKYGGIAWPFPRPWNSARRQDIPLWLKYTKIALSRLT